MKGVTRLPDRWLTCMDSAHTLPDLTGRLFAERFFPPTYKKRVKINIQCLTLHCKKSYLAHQKIKLIYLWGFHLVFIYYLLKMKEKFNKILN